MTDINTTNPEVRPSSPFVILQKPKLPESQIIPERKLVDKRLEAVSDIKYNGEVVQRGTIFKITNQDVFDHFLKYGAIKEVL